MWLFNKYARKSAAPNLFYVCHRHRFLFLSIAKNACTSIKHLIYEQDQGHAFAVADPEQIHAHFGFRPRAGLVVDRRDRQQLQDYPGYRRFVVYRDPVARLLSAYRDKTNPGSVRHPFFAEQGLIGMALDPFLDVLEEILALKDPLLIDEHLRPQHLCFEAGDVDDVVPLPELTAYLSMRFGLPAPAHHNSARHAVPELLPTQRERIQRLYARDYEIRLTYTLGTT